MTRDEMMQWKEHQERLYAMAVDDGETWDLSDNDQAACNAGGDAILALLRATPAPVAAPPAVLHIEPVYACLSCMRQVPSSEVWQEPRRKSEPVYTHHVAGGHPVVRIEFREQSVAFPVAAPPADLVATCEWSEDANGEWHTGCGTLFVFDTDGPSEHKFGWCHHCGKPLAPGPFLLPEVPK